MPTMKDGRFAFRPEASALRWLPLRTAGDAFGFLLIAVFLVTAYTTWQTGS
jgi:hypothetical protein